MANALKFIIEGDDRSKDAFRQVLENLGKTEQKSGGLIAKWRDLTVVATGIKRVFDSVASALGGMFKETESAIGAEVRLAVALAKTTGNLGGAVKELKDWAGQRSAVTTFSDDFTLSLAAIGAQMGLTGQQLKDTVTGAQDTAIALGKEPKAMMESLSKFVVGASDGLRGFGIALDSTVPHAQEVSRVLALVNTGLSETWAKLPTSPLTQLSNAFGDLREKLGEVVASTGVFQTAMGTVRGWVQSVTDALSDTEKFKALVKGIDEFFDMLLKNMKLAAAGVLSVVGNLLKGFELLLNALNTFATAAGLMRAVEDRAAALRTQVEALAEAGKHSTEEYRVLNREMIMLDKQIDATRGTVDLGSQSLLTYAFGLRLSAEAAESFNKSASLVSDIIDEIANKVRRAAPEIKKGLTPEEKELLETFERFSALLEEQGAELAGVFSLSFQEAFDSDVGIENAFGNLGDRVRRTFVAQFSDAAFAPLKATFGALATTLAQPFQIIGNLVNAILSPITGLINSIISSLIGKLLGLVNLQGLAATTGLAGLAAVAAGAQLVASSWGAAAVAASIGSFGAALSVVPATLSSIASGAALARALAVPALAEGGVIPARPGGTLARIGEGGKPEAVVPLHRAHEFGFGGGGSGIVNHFHGPISLMENAEETIKDLGRQFLRRIIEGRNLTGFGRGVI